jgi:hypothetical protein
MGGELGGLQIMEGGQKTFVELSSDGALKML